MTKPKERFLNLAYAISLILLATTKSDYQAALWIRDSFPGVYQIWALNIWSPLKARSSKPDIFGNAEGESRNFSAVIWSIRSILTVSRWTLCHRKNVGGVISGKVDRKPTRQVAMAVTMGWESDEYYKF